MSLPDHDILRREVRNAYGAVARHEGGGCCASQPANIAGERLGYDAAELEAAPEGANLGLGCGNPHAIAALKTGETVLDLGSGAGFDTFLAARAVGKTGRVIGVDMTPEMVTKARANAHKGTYAQVEFRLGEIESLPVADSSVDVIISNCVINLSPDKARVFREAFRVLKPGGRLAISDVVASNALPEDLRQDLHLYSCCISGALSIAELEAALGSSGFTNICITPKEESRAFIRDWAPGRGIENFVVSAHIEAVKPGVSAMNTQTETSPALHPSIVALVSLAANIASNHPNQGQCQIDRLKQYGVTQEQIDTVIEIARHIRDEAARTLDARFDAAQVAPARTANPFANIAVVEASNTCCSSTTSGQSCC